MYIDTFDDLWNAFERFTIIKLFDYAFLFT